VPQQPCPSVRAALDHQQRRALRQRLRTEKLALGAGGGRRVLLIGEVGTKRGGPLPGDVFSPLVIVVIGHRLLPSRLLWRRHARPVRWRVLDRCARLRGEDRGNGFGLVAGDISERPNGAVGQFRAELVGGTGRVGVGEDL
jgi:hypothetical protein